MATLEERVAELEKLIGGLDTRAVVDSLILDTRARVGRWALDVAEDTASAQAFANDAALLANTRYYQDEADFLANSTNGDYGIYAGSVWLNDTGSATFQFDFFGKVNNINTLKAIPGFGVNSIAHVKGVRGGIFRIEDYEVQINNVGGYTIGNGITLTVDAIERRLFSGQVLEFTGGGVFTLTADADAGDTSITGDLTVSSVADDEQAGLQGDDITIAETAEDTSSASRWVRQNFELTINDITELEGFSGGRKLRLDIYEYGKGTGVGGGKLSWDAEQDKQNHNGGTIFSPTWSNGVFGDTADSNWYSPDGSDTGTGCWVRDVTDSFYVEDFGAKPGDTDYNNARAFYGISNYINNSGGSKSVFFRCRKYYTNPITAGSPGALFKINAPNVAIWGNGAEIILDAANTVSYNVFDWNTDNVYRKNYWLSDINIINERVWEDELDQRGTQFLTLHAGENFHIQDVVGHHPEQYGIQLRENADADLKDVWFTRVKMDYVSRAGSNGFIPFETLANTSGTGLTQNLFVHDCYFRTKDPDGFNLTNTGSGAVAKLQAVHNAHFTKTYFIEDKPVADLINISPGRDATTADKMSTEIYFNDCVVSNHDYSIHTLDITANDVEVVIEFNNVRALNQSSSGGRFVVSNNLVGVTFINCNNCQNIQHVTTDVNNRVPRGWKFINCEFTRPSNDMILSVAYSEFRDCTFVDANQLTLDAAYDCHGNKFINCDFKNIRVNLNASANAPATRDEGLKLIKCTFDDAEIDSLLPYSTVDDGHMVNHDNPVKMANSNCSIIDCRIEIPFASTTDHPIIFTGADSIFAHNHIYQPAGAGRGLIPSIFSDTSIIYQGNTVDCNFTSLGNPTIINYTTT